MGGMMGGLMDSTTMGQSFFFTIGPDKGFCHTATKGCTVLGGKVGVMFTDGSPANPATGMPMSSFTPVPNFKSFKKPRAHISI